MDTLIRIATRKSKLALWQAHHVAEQLHAKGIKTELIPVITKGDRILNIPLAEIGGKGLFLKEIEDTLLRKEADIAVHSMKDVPSVMPESLLIAAMLEREDPRDALIGAKSIESIPTGATIGTASLRRHAQLIAIRPDISIKTLRGNVDTRLQKQFEGEYTAIVLATAGLKRLNLEHHIGVNIPHNIMLPAVSQGCIGIQCRADDQNIIALLKTLEHTATMLSVSAERAANAMLGGSCHSPIAIHGSWLNHHRLQLEGVVGNLTGRLIKQSCEAKVSDLNEAKQLGEHLAHKLYQQGAQALMQEAQVSTQ